MVGSSEISDSNLMSCTFRKRQMGEGHSAPNGNLSLLVVGNSGRLCFCKCVLKLSSQFFFKFVDLCSRELRSRLFGSQ